jgi:hypothetical protein
MPTPTASDVHVNVPLTNISVAWAQQQSNFVADQVFPNIPVPQQSNLYFKYQRDDWYRSEAEVRAPGTESAGGGWHLSTDSYAAVVYAIHKDVDDQIRANADSVISMDRDATMWVTTQLLLKRDLLWAAQYFVTGSGWTGGNGANLTGVAGAPGANQFKQWDAAGSTPIEDLRKQRILMAEKTGYRPNVLVLSAHVWRVLQDHPEFLDRVKYTQRGEVSTDLLASLCEIDKVVVSYGVASTNAEGQTEATSFVFGKNALLLYSPSNPGLMQPSAGYTFSWTGYTGAGIMGSRIKTFRMEQLNADRVEGEMAFSLKQVAPELGQMFLAAVA